MSFQPQGLLHPAMYAILGMWAPPKERTVLIAIAHSGMMLCLVTDCYKEYIFRMRLRYIVGAYNWFFGIGCAL